MSKYLSAENRKRGLNLQKNKTKDKKKKTDKICTKDVCEGQVFKNYAEFCKALKIKPKASGNSKKLQIKKIEELIKFKKEGQRIIILSIEEEETRGTNSVYYKCMSEALIIILYDNSKHNDYYYTTKTDLLVNLGFINKNFSKCRANIDSIAYYLGIDKLILINFFKINIDRINSVFKYNINKFISEHNDCFELDKGFIRLAFDVSEENEKARYRLATYKEMELINECELEVLKELDINSREELQYRDKWNIFVKKSLEKIRKYEEFKLLKFYYKLYRFEINKYEIEKLYNDLKDKDLDKKVSKINKHSKKAAKESIVDRQKKASGRLLKNDYDKDYEKDRDKILIKEDVIKQNNLCMNSFIKSTAKEIDMNKVIKSNRKKRKKEVTIEEVIDIEIEEDEETSWGYDITTENNIPF